MHRAEHFDLTPSNTQNSMDELTFQNAELEFRSYDDKVWYDARFFLSDGGQTRSVRHPDDEIITVFDAYNFDQNLDEFRSRFPPMSV